MVVSDLAEDLGKRYTACVSLLEKFLEFDFIEIYTEIQIHNDSMDMVEVVVVVMALVDSGKVVVIIQV